jgi:hypothetical protein
MNPQTSYTQISFKTVLEALAVRAVPGWQHLRVRASRGDPRCLAGLTRVPVLPGHKGFSDSLVRIPQPQHQGLIPLVQKSPPPTSCPPAQVPCTVQREKAWVG